MALQNQTEANTKRSFNQASTQSAQEAAIRARSEKAKVRLGARHEANQAQQVAKRVLKLSRSDRPTPSLKPSWAVEDRQAWLTRAAKYQVRTEHHARIGKIQKVADRMISGQSGAEKKRSGLER